MASKVLKFSSSLRELRIHLCQKSESSRGVRQFIQDNYVSMKKQHPCLPILIRECSGVQPRLWARFEQGKESSVPLTSLSSVQVQEKLSLLSQQQ